MSSTSDDGALRAGLHVLTTVLLVAAVVPSIRMPVPTAAASLLALTVFAVLYFVGALKIDRWSSAGALSWTLLLTLAWVFAVIVDPLAIYLVFPLFFIYLGVMPDIRGVVSVVFAVGVVIIVQIPRGLTLGGVMGPAVSALVTLAIFYAFRKIEKINEERALLQDQLAESEHEAGIIAERERLAHEIHDTVAQGQSSIMLLLHAAERDLRTSGAEGIDGALERIGLARQTASDNLAEARAMIAALQPPALEAQSLPAAMRRMAENFSQAGGLAIDVDVEGREGELPPAVEAALLRIAQGAVGNVVKHAHASRCRITLTYEVDETRLDVVDNGRGFDVAEVEAKPAGLGHVGLEAMRKRAAEQGGTMKVESQPGGPTAICVVIPVGRGVAAVK